MNFLQLAKRLRSEAGISGTGPATVIDQVGEMLNVVEWIESAYEDIQNAREHWKFLQTDFSFTTTAALAEYTRAALGYDELRSWRTDSFQIYSTVTDECPLYYEPYESFKACFLYGSSRAQTGRPTYFSVKPDRSLILWPTPDAVYTVSGDYFKRAQTMSANTDEPLFPQEYHMIIVWRALLFYGAKNAAPEKHTHGYNEYERIMRRMETEQLPEITWGGNPIG